MRVEVRVLGDRTGSLEARTIADPTPVAAAAASAATPTPPPGDPATSPAPAGATVSLRALVEHVVRAEVAAFDDRERQRRFVRLLTPDELADGASAGKVDPGGRSGTRQADPEHAVATALEAYDDGLYLVVVDGEQVQGLDTAVTVGPDTLVRFVRLTALAGG
jgi:hypothetical protein